MRYMLLGLALIATIGFTKPQIYIHTMYAEITPGYTQRMVLNLNNAKQGDLITLDILSPGGSLTETLLLAEAMINTKALITCNVRSASSGAAIVVMLCHEKIMQPRGRVMFHYASHRGRLNPLVPKYITNPIELVGYEQLKDLYIRLGIKDLMTDQEWTYMNEGEDIVFTTEEFARRCTASPTCTLSIR